MTAPRWLEQLAMRLGLQSRLPEFGTIALHRRRVFIVPTRTGLMFAAALLIMLLTAVNYQLALGYALTFLMASVALISMVHTWRNLLGLTLQAGRADPTHMGELLEWSVLLNNPDGRERCAIEVSIPGSVQIHQCTLAGQSEHLLQVALPATHRGWLQVPRLQVATCWPLGFWRAWAWWQPRTALLVWPRLESPAPPLPDDGLQGDQRSGPGHDNFAAIRPFHTGDSPRRLAWKAMARLGTDDLLVQQFEGGRGGQLDLLWDSLPTALAPEARLSRLARWVVDADAAGLQYSLTLPGTRISLNAGPAHRLACLEALALAQI